MALVPITHVYDTLSVINNTGLLDGQILYTTDQTVNKIFADVKVNNILRRIEIGGTNTIDTELNQESGHAIANSAVAKLAQTVHTNLLNPTLGTTTISGITCTANGDGTYTLSGTSSTQPGLILCSVSGLSGKHKLVGCPSGGGQYNFNISYRVDGEWSSKYETGNGLEIDCDPTKTYQFEFVIRANQTLPNVTFKPMLTTDLSATYDDYVPYSGNGELNENVADLYNNLNTTNTNLTALDTKVGAQSLLPTPSQSVTQNINTLKAEINQLNSDLTVLNNVSKKYRLGEPTFITTSGITVLNDGIVVINISPSSNQWGACAIDGVTTMQFFGNADIYTVHTCVIKAGQIVSSSFSNAQLVSVKYYPYVLR